MSLKYSGNRLYGQNRR